MDSFSLDRHCNGSYCITFAMSCVFITDRGLISKMGTTTYGLIESNRTLRGSGRCFFRETLASHLLKP